MRENSGGSRVQMALLAVIASFGTANAESTAQPSLRLEFDWGKEWVARIEAVKSKATSDAKQPSVLKATYSARTLQTEGGYEAEFADLEFTIDGVKANEQEMLAVLNGLVLLGRVAGDGTFFEFYDFAAIQRRAQDAYGKEFAGRPGATPAAIERAIAVGTSRDALQSEATRTWNALVGRWVGLELTPGTSLVTSMQMRVPVIDRQVETRVQWSIVGRERCSKAHVEATCVRLRSSGRPDAEALKKAIDEWVRGLGAPSGLENVRFMDAREDVEILTEPASLKPHWARWSRQITALGNEGGKSKHTTQTDTTTMRFAYPERAD